MANNKFYLERDLLKSKVFRSLCKTSMVAYFDFRMKCKWQSDKKKRGKRENWYIINNGDIEYTYSEAEKRGIPRASFMRAIDELIGKGFIDVVHSGSGGVKGDKSKYGISQRWRDWGTDEFVKKARPRDTRRGRGFATYWKRIKANMGIKKDNLPVTGIDNPQLILKLKGFQK